MGQHHRYMRTPLEIRLSPYDKDYLFRLCRKVGAVTLQDFNLKTQKPKYEAHQNCRAEYCNNIKMGGLVYHGLCALCVDLNTLAFVGEIESLLSSIGSFYSKRKRIKINEYKKYKL